MGIYLKYPNKIRRVTCYKNSIYFELVVHFQKVHFILKLFFLKLYWYKTIFFFLIFVERYLVTLISLGFSEYVPPSGITNEL
jgi:hypothetical protein